MPGLGGILPETTLSRAAKLLNGNGFRLLRISGFYQSPAFPPGSGPDFVNAAAVFAGDLSPEAALGHLHAVEDRLGRSRTDRWAPRRIDLDLVAVDDLVLPDAATLRHWQTMPPKRQERLTPDRLLLPHPRMQDRAFVLVPLAEVAPGWVHPLSGLSVAAMLADLSQRSRHEIVRLSAAPPV